MLGKVSGMLILQSKFFSIHVGLHRNHTHALQPAFDANRCVCLHPDIHWLLCMQVLVYGDCAVNVQPSAAELAQIAVTSADTAAAFGVSPRVALLSYSTLGSGSGPEVDRVRPGSALADWRDNSRHATHFILNWVTWQVKAPVLRASAQSSLAQQRSGRSQELQGLTCSVHVQRERVSAASSHRPPAPHRRWRRRCAWRARRGRTCRWRARSSTTRRWTPWSPSKRSRARVRWPGAPTCASSPTSTRATTRTRRAPAAER